MNKQSKDASYVRKIPTIRSMDKEMTEAQKNRENHGDVDIQERISTTMSMSQIHEGMRMLYGFSPQHLPQMTDFQRISFLALLRHSTATMARGEDLRYCHLAAMFLTQLDTVGRDGTTCLAFVSNAGNMNKCNHKTITGMAPHRNALLCPVAALGNLFLFRWQIQHEDHPIFTQHETVYGNPLFPAPGDVKKTMNYSMMRSLFQFFFQAMKIPWTKLTHAPRVLAHFLLEQAGCDRSQLQRLAGREISVTANSYLLQLPPEAIALSAGFKKKNFQDAPTAPHLSVPVPDELFALALPWYADELLAVEQAREAAAGNRKAFSAKKLITALGSIQAVGFAVKVSLAAAAAHVRDEHGALLLHLPPMYLMFPQFPVYKHLRGVFEDDSFLRFAQRVNDAEIAEVTLSSLTAQAAAAEPTMDRFFQQVTPIFEAMNSEFSKLRAEVRVAVSAMQPPPSAGTIGAAPLLPVTTPEPAETDDDDSVHYNSDNDDTALSTGKKKRRKIVRAKVSLLSHHVLMPQFKHITNAHHFWNIYSKGINGQKSLKQLEHESTSWRSYRNGKQRWSDMKLIGDFIEHHIDGLNNYDSAVQHLQGIIDEVGRQGKSTAPNWVAVRNKIKSFNAGIRPAHV